MRRCDARAKPIGRLRQLLADGALDLPLPAGGETAARFIALAGLAAGPRTCPSARLAEAHCDAAAIVAEAGRTLAPGVLGRRVGLAVRREQAVAKQLAGGWHLSGELAFCSGASILDIALVDACTPGEAQQLFARAARRRRSRRHRRLA